jgi:acetyl esterase
MVSFGMALALGATAAPAGAQSAPHVQSGIQYADPEGQAQLLDVYEPSGGGPFPAVVLVHGGGWQWGDRTNMADVAAYLAQNEFVAFTIDYRLANTRRKYDPYPAAVEDVKAAIRWVRDHASQYHVDPARLGLLGSSAGAHLASLVGMEGKGPLDRGDRVAAVVSWSGPQDMAELYRDGPQQAKSAVVAFTNCHGGADACAAILKEISPLTYVDPSDPPLFFSNGSNELVPILQATEMDGALATGGVQHQFVEVPGTLHAQHYIDRTAPSLPAGQTVRQASLAWLQKWLVLGPAPQVSPTQAAPSVPPASDGSPPGSKRSSALMFAVFGIAGLALLVFVAGAVAVALRRRARRARRVREWKAGQPRTRTRSGSSSGSGRSRSSSGHSRSSSSRPR